MISRAVPRPATVARKKASYPAATRGIEPGPLACMAGRYRRYADPQPAGSAGYSALAAFFGPFIGRLCLMQSARYVEARVTALANLGSPVITLVLAWAVLDDLPTGYELLGGLVMLVGIAFPIVAWARRSSSSTNPS